jgi:hypothetical protein
LLSFGLRVVAALLFYRDEGGPAHEKAFLPHEFLEYSGCPSMDRLTIPKVSLAVLEIAIALNENRQISQLA